MSKNLKKMVSLLMVVLMALSLAACGSSKPAADEKSDLKEVDVVLDWYPNSIHTFLYEAIDNGYFEEEGLKVNLITPADSVDAISFVSSGKAQVGITAPYETIVANADGLPVCCIGAITQVGMSDMIVTFAGNGITSDMTSLKGKKLGYSGSIAKEAMITMIAENAGLKKDDFELVDCGYDQVTALTSGSVDGCLSLMKNYEVVQLEDEGYDVETYKFTDYGMPAISDLFVFAANKDLYEKDPEMYAGFIRACKKGFDDMKADEDAAIKLVMSEMSSDENPLEEESERKSYEILIPDMETDDAPFLSLKADDWQEFIDWMYECKLIDKQIKAEDIVIEFE